MTVVLGDFGVLELAGTLHRVAGGVHSDSHAMGHQLRRMFHFHFPSSTLPAQRRVDQRSQTQELSLFILPRTARTPARARDLERPGAILSSDLELSLSILRQRPGAILHILLSPWTSAYGPGAILHKDQRPGAILHKDQRPGAILHILRPETHGKHPPHPPGGRQGVKSKKCVRSKSDTIRSPGGPG
jgi:hypothetical protein